MVDRITQNSGLLISGNGANRCDCCGPYYRLQDCDCVAQSLWVRQSAVNVGDVLTYEGVCYRVTSTLFGAVPAGHTEVTEFALGECCDLYRPAGVCHDGADPNGISGYVPESLAPGYYVRSGDGCCIFVHDVDPVHVCPGQRMSGTFTPEPDYCCRDILIDVAGLDASVCASCSAGWKWTLSVDGTYSLPNGSDLTDFPGQDDSNAIQRFSLPNCNGTVQQEFHALLTLGIVLDCSRRTVTAVRIQGVFSGPSGSAQAFTWTGSEQVADGVWLDNQVQACDTGSPGGFFNQKIATGGQVRVRFAP